MGIACTHLGGVICVVVRVAFMETKISIKFADALYMFDQEILKFSPTVIIYEQDFARLTCDF